MSAAAATDAQFRLFEAVSGCLKELAVDRPLLVVIDDLHWADEPSVRLLGFLARALAGSRVLLAGAYRDTEASTGLLESRRQCAATDAGRPRPGRCRGHDRGHRRVGDCGAGQLAGCGNAAAATRSLSAS